MVAQLFGKFFGVKVDDAVRAGTETLFRIDPKGMSEAQIRQMSAELDNLGRRVAAAKTDVEREMREAVAARNTYTQNTKAAEILADKADKETDSTRKKSIETTLNELIERLERDLPEVEREEREVAEAQAFFGQLQEAYESAGSKLRAARSALEAAQRDQKSASLARERAADRKKSAEEAAGIIRSTNSMNVALDAMRANAERDREAAAADSMKVDLLSPMQGAKGNSILADALKEAAGESASPMSARDRLAALRKPAA